MVDLKTFDDLLDRTVRAPRLSGTKVGELRDMAKSLAAQHSDDIVAILTRTNASLQPASTSRISSLYVFDAIARAAKSDAALLGKMEAAVGGFVDSIIDNGKGGVWSEGRDKTRKIVDIWRKSQTFSDGCIADLQGKIAGGDDRRPNGKIPFLSPHHPSPFTSAVRAHDGSDAVPRRTDLLRPVVSSHSLNRACITLSTTLLSVGLLAAGLDGCGKKEGRIWSHKQAHGRLIDSTLEGLGCTGALRSTTPPGAPPPHILARYKGLYSGSGTQSPAGSRSPPPAPGQLPPEIMAMLGVKSKADEKAETASAIDAVLANVRGTSTATPPPGSAPAPAPVPSFDPAQLAALANIAAITSTPTPPPAAPPAAPPAQSYPQSQGQGGYRRGRSRSPERRDGDRSDRDRDRGRWRDGDGRDRRGYAREDSRDRYYDRRDSRDYRDDRRDSRDMRDGYRDDRRDSRDDRRDSRDSRDRRDGGREGGRTMDRAPPGAGPGASRLPPKPAGLPPNPTLPSRPDGLPSRPADSPPTRRRDWSQDPHPHSHSSHSHSGYDRRDRSQSHGDRGSHDRASHDRPSHDRGGSYGGGQGGGSGGAQGGNGGSGGATLQTFDLTSFNPATPESWSALAQAWQNTTGRQPNQFELMQFLATGAQPDSSTNAGGSGSGGEGGEGSGGGMGGMFGMPGMMGMGGMGMGGMGGGMGGMGGGMGGMGGMNGEQ
ncbi:hypothetical protein A1Q1_07618 [Trichosporon asahii var. asahii CBS 2479]|uniref:CID domain-containing protein n=1 Tax=Trichosporon asahii var. asahii (strain ATCC 90039 / CBS 2479 / JCM 2466 / KCTC 7840 / NBRC 103889/ NCYC 2677 / UAMH 7654) TaxID=1186058 RepID=J6F2G0_TRIAS|nr:hypothetical protein A1Q1_07618 [Trichosporon asahii var. asahii CBS 2479]EJT51154.1 hypothetical protein A1Q1_07618 [Trichosporon asahii var. asahii CBS 2479]